MLFQKKIRMSENEGYYNTVHTGKIRYLANNGLTIRLIFYDWACSADLWGQNREK